MKGKKKGKYYLDKKSLLWLAFAIVLLFGAYTGLHIWQNQLPEKNLWIDFAQNIVMIFISVLGAAFLSTILIEINNNNNVTLDAILNDVVASEKTMQILSPAHKRELTNKLLGIDASPKGEFMNYIIESLQKEEGTFYYEECIAIVDCKIEGDKITKSINRCFKILSYEKKKKLEHHNFLVITGGEEQGVDLIVDSILVNNVEWHKEDYEFISEDVSTENSIMQKSHYRKRKICRAKKDIVLNCDTPTELVVNYTTIVPLNDTHYSFRVSAPCKKYKLDFQISGETDCELNTNAFGFMDDANKASNIVKNDNRVIVEFSNWIFKRDGAVISFNPKKIIKK